MQHIYMYIDYTAKQIGRRFSFVETNFFNSTKFINGQISEYLLSPYCHQECTN